jgi:hypothetical protein
MDQLKEKKGWKNDPTNQDILSHPSRGDHVE